MAEEGEAALVVPGYEGERDSAGKRHGAGVATHGNGDVYRGAYRHGRRHGHGEYVFKVRDDTHRHTETHTETERDRHTGGSVLGPFPTLSHAGPPS
jgi:hypothetical protein